MTWFQAAKAVWQILKPTELNQGEQEMIDRHNREWEMQKDQHDQHIDAYYHDQYQNQYDYGTSHDTSSSSGNSIE
jgi:hypothetical protein